MMGKIDKMELWRSVEKTPFDQTKPIIGKAYKGTSPKPYYLIQKATETFGPCGIGWGFRIVDERIEDAGPAGKMSIARVAVWYNWSEGRGEVEHIGGTPFCGSRKDGTPFIDEDAPKKSVTDALIKALSMLGFAGDIFIGRYDDSKYVNDLKDYASERKEKEATKNEVRRGRASSAPATQTPFDDEPQKIYHIAVPIDEDGASCWGDWAMKMENALLKATEQTVLAEIWKQNSAALKELKIVNPYNSEQLGVKKDEAKRRLGWKPQNA